MTKTLATCSGVFVICCAASAPAAVVSFDTLLRGAKVTNQYNSSDGLTMTAWKAGPGSGGTTPIIFDTRVSGEPDPDLKPAYVGGNLAKSPTRPANLIVIPENVTDADKNGRVDVPSDEESGGIIQFQFNKPLNAFGFDAIDVNNVTASYANRFRAEFVNNGATVATVWFNEFLKPTSKYYDPTVKFGDRSSNRIKPITAQQLGVPQFTAVKLYAGESAGFDSINYTVVPEPASAGLLAAAGALLCARRRRV